MNPELDVPIPPSRVPPKPRRCGFFQPGPDWVDEPDFPDSDGKPMADNTLQAD